MQVQLKKQTTLLVIEFVENAQQFIENYINKTSDQEILWITGSLYFISFVRKIFIK